MEQQLAKIEAVLFAMGEPVTIRDLAQALDVTAEEAETMADMLRAQYDAEERGLELLRLDDAYQMTTRKSCYDSLIRLAVHEKKPVLTDPLLETLAIIAYKQPVTKLDISNIRGVSSDFAVNRLIEYGLIREAGRKNAPGRPMLFVTTDEFLRRFQLETVEGLPELAPDQLEEIREDIYEETGYDPEQEAQMKPEGREARKIENTPEDGEARKIKNAPAGLISQAGLTGNAEEGGSADGSL